MWCLRSLSCGRKTFCRQTFCRHGVSSTRSRSANSQLVDAFLFRPNVCRQNVFRPKDAETAFRVDVSNRRDGFDETSVGRNVGRQIFLKDTAESLT